MAKKTKKVKASDLGPAHSEDAGGGTAVMDGPPERFRPGNDRRVICEISPDFIKFEPTNHREPSEAEVDAKAESMRIHGLLQPIEVVRGDRCLDAKGKPMGQIGDFFVVFGHQRVIAARKLGWQTIEAYEIEDPLTLADRLGRRALENLGHAPLTAVEECLAVALMYERSSAQFEEDKILDVAAGLGRSARWVRDRMSIASLSGDARDLVAAGRLTLGHAREIARLSDPALRDDIADMAARDEEGGRGMSIPEVRDWVIARLRSLKVVPWQTDVPFAGKPACIGCPANSASNSTLFDGALDGMNKSEKGELEPRLAEGLCTNPTCFESKQRAVTKSIEAAQERARAKAKGVKGEEERREILNSTRAADFVKPASAKRQIAKVILPQSAEAKKPAKSSTSAYVDSYNSPENKAKRKWAQDCEEAIMKFVKASPLQILTMLLIDQTTVGMNDKECMALIKPLGPALASPSQDVVDRLVQLYFKRSTDQWKKGPYRGPEFAILLDMDTEALFEAGTMLGISMPGKPGKAENKPAKKGKK